MAGMPKYRDPKTEYVQTDISLRKLAKKWKLPFGTISSRNKKQGWSNLRAQYRDKLNTKIEEKSIDLQADTATRIHENVGKTLLLTSTAMLTCVELITERRGKKFTLIHGSDESKNINNVMSALSRAVGTVGNINEKTNDLYNLNSGESDGDITKDIAALVRLAHSQSPDSPPGRILPN